MYKLTSQLLLILYVCLFGVSCQGEARTPDRYLIPDGYVGWIRIDFEIAGAPEIIKKDGFNIIPVPESGLVETSSKLEYGSALDEYYYDDGVDRQKLRQTTYGVEGGMVWGGFNGTSTTADGKSQTYEYFFVGTEEQFVGIGKPELATGNKPKAGNRKSVPVSKVYSSN